MTKKLKKKSFIRRVHATIAADGNLRLGESDFALAMQMLRQKTESFGIEAPDGSALSIMIGEDDFTLTGTDAGINFLTESPTRLGDIQDSVAAGNALSDPDFFALVGSLGSGTIRYDGPAVIPGVSVSDWIEKWLPAWGAAHAGASTGAAA